MLLVNIYLETLHDGTFLSLCLSLTSSTFPESSTSNPLTQGGGLFIGNLNDMCGLNPIYIYKEDIEKNKQMYTY